MSDEGLAPGKRLSEIRQQQGLSQRRAAELSGLTHSAISTIEQDKVSPAISTLQKLLKVYGLSLSEFFSEPEKPDEPQVVINQDDLIEMGSQGVSMKLVHNGNPNRTLAMIFETYQEIQFLLIKSYPKPVAFLYPKLISLYQNRKKTNHLQYFQSYYDH